MIAGTQAEYRKIFFSYLNDWLKESQNTYPVHINNTHMCSYYIQEQFIILIRELFQVLKAHLLFQMAIFSCYIICMYFDIHVCDLLNVMEKFQGD